MTVENTMTIEELENILLDAEEIEGTKCRYGLEYECASGNRYASLRRTWSGEYVLDGGIKNKEFSSHRIPHIGHVGYFRRLKPEVE